MDAPGEIAPKDARKLAVLFFDQLQVLEEGTHAYQYARNTVDDERAKAAVRRFAEDPLLVAAIGATGT
ncbi:RNA polymerase sigma factor SigF, partial [Streptomyces griseus]